MKTTRQKAKSRDAENKKRSARRAAKKANPTREICVVTARCIGCKKKSVIREDQAPKDPAWAPMCKACFMPLVAISATLVREPVPSPRTPPETNNG